eukprot:1189971-Prorocentrum_minimum.AAC.1
MLPNPMCWGHHSGSRIASRPARTRRALPDRRRPPAPHECSRGRTHRGSPPHSFRPIRINPISIPGSQLRYRRTSALALVQVEPKSHAAHMLLAKSYLACSDYRMALAILSAAPPPVGDEPDVYADTFVE